ncbi:sunset domain-containing protein [Terrabacter sp. AAH1]
MSDTVKLVLWIAVAVVVIGIIVWLFVNAGRRREVEARRFEAGELRARVEERLPEVQGRQDRASVTAAMAQDARAEAERIAAEAKRRADEARRLEQQAAHHAATAESARAEHADLERQADRVDPDVRTDDEGYRIDEDGNRLPGQEDSSRQRSSGAAGAAGGLAAGAGGATFAAAHDDDDEDDLADAENPFAPSSASAPEPMEQAAATDATAHTTSVAAEDTSEVSDESADESADAAGTSRHQEPAWEPSDPGAGHSHPATRDESSGEEAVADGAVGDEAGADEAGADEASREEVTEKDGAGAGGGTAMAGAGAGYAEGEPGDAGADSDDTVDGDPVDEQTNDEATAQRTTGEDEVSATETREAADDTLPAGTDEGDVDDGVASESASTSESESEVEPKSEPKGADDEDHVDVPALDDRDELIADGGTPAEDPGDHRGQPWATTPGQRGPEESDEPSDEGQDVDMAPHSHESDEVSDVDEPVGSTSEEPRRQDAEPASDVAEAAYPDEEGDADRTTDATTDATTDSAGDSATDSAGTQTQTGDTAYAGGAADEDAGPAQATAASSGRRVSEFDEVVDGGFGLGSAAPIGDGAQPLGHAIKGTREGTTFLGPDDEGYDDAEPDVWFYNEEAARRAGFTKRGE